MKNKIIGIICAMDIEMNQLKDSLSNVTCEKYLNYEFYLGDYFDNKVVITKCGIGKVNAAVLTTLLVEHYNPDFIFNSGIAGGYSKKLKTLDVVIATKLVYSDVDMTTDAFTNLRYGQLQDFPLFFLPDEVLISKLRNHDFDANIHYGTIMTGDQFVTDYQKTHNIVLNHFQDLNILACDMESCAIAQVCYLTKTKFIVVRSISDIIGSSDGFDYNTFAPVAANNASNIVEYIIKNIEL